MQPINEIVTTRLSVVQITRFDVEVNVEFQTI